MKIFAKHTMGHILKGDALKISEEAKNAKKINPNVIDATIGTYYGENQEFKSFSVVDEIIKNLNDKDFYTYSPSDGGVEFENSILNWLFLDNKNTIINNLNAKVIATPGGTGAISTSVFNSLDTEQELLIPNLSWGPYIGIAKEKSLNTVKFSLFHEDKFNLNDFINKANDIIKKQGKLVAIINDPCNNPTGYSLTYTELISLINYLNSLDEIPVLLIYDIAYFDFALDREKELNKLLLFNNLNKNVTVSLCFSASKSFSVYGLRLGALVLLGKDKEVIEEFYNISNYTARNTWSNSSKPVISMIKTLNNNLEFKVRYFKELEDIKDVIKKRSEIFMEEANKIGLKYYPYHSGFFITIPCNNNDLIVMKLKEENGIYVVPFDNSIRISLCSLPSKSIYGLALKILNILNKYN